MAEISRVALFGKLNSLAYKGLESAAMFCKLRGNPYVELAHWLHQVLQGADSDLHRIVRHFGLDVSRLSSDLVAALDDLPGGASSISDMSSHLEEAVERAWTYSTLLFGEWQVRTGHLVVACLKTPTLRNMVMGISRELAKIKVEELTENFAKIVAGSPEDALSARDGISAQQGDAAGAEGGAAAAPAAMGKQDALKRYSVDLTERAAKGEMDPIVGREEEIRQVIDILMRRRQNNPILTGEAGVGKTAVVEGLAQRIASGDVPPSLKDICLRVLDVGLLQAGASMKGEFENRLRQVIEEVQASPRPIVLFIDEAHTLIGAGGQAGTGDAANLLKPALARGTLRTIAATTWSEYKKYIEKDPALTRRFQVVKIDEPSEATALLMMRGLASVLEKHHRVEILDEALEACVGLSHRYIPARQLPDKAISLLDTACARVAISQHSVPPRVADCRRRIEGMDTEHGILDREGAIGLDHVVRKGKLDAALAAEKERLAGLEEHWKQEKELVTRILEIRAALRAGAQPIEGDGTTGVSPVEKGAGATGVGTTGVSSVAAGPGPGTDRRDACRTTAPASAASAQSAKPQASPAAAPDQPTEQGSGKDLDGRDARRTEAPLSPEERQSLLEELRGLQKKLAECQGEDPLLLPSVDAQAVATVVAGWTGIPVGRMVRDQIGSVLGLVASLEKRVLGQRPALEAIARRIQTSRAGLLDPRRPIGVFLLAGPSGVGKTESAQALAEALYGGEQNVITINMSEFQEAHTVSTLKGAPPGYVGYGEGGVLTEAVRRRPYSVVLLDEVEKAHHDVHEVFFQVFDKGWMEDGEGRVIDFKNTVILLTTNVGSERIASLCKDPALLPAPEALAGALREPLLKTFPAAFLGRLTVVPYLPIADAVLRDIIRLQLGRVVRRMRDSSGAELVFDEAVVGLIAARCTEVESGARMIDAILTNTVLPEISRECLSRMMQGQKIETVSVAVEDGTLKYSFQGIAQA